VTCAFFRICPVVLLNVTRDGEFVTTGWRLTEPYCPQAAGDPGTGSPLTMVW
jgi:hypothetical protein